MDNCSPFKWRHFEAEIILLCVRWYLRYSLSYRDLEAMMLERGLHGPHHDLPLGAVLCPKTRQTLSTSPQSHRPASRGGRTQASQI